MILVLDNYDSFTYNLVQYVCELGAETMVRRNDCVTVQEIEAELRPRKIIISPGPGTPDDAGITLELIAHFAGRVPLFGVCLGHQAIGQHFGGRIVRAASPVHGKTAEIAHDSRTIFAGLSSPLIVGRYHSLLVEPSCLPTCLEVSAQTANAEIMALRHREMQVEGVQFHPESILTIEGKQLLANFLKS